MMDKKLEEIKKIGNYAVTVYYGEEVGCDDFDVKKNDRRVICTYFPVGHLGEGRVYWKGKYRGFMKFDFNQKPGILNNPPGEEAEKDGFYTWGSDSYINSLG